MSLITLGYCVACHSLFLIADALYYSSLKGIFFVFRFTSVVIAACLHLLIRKRSDLFTIQVLGIAQFINFSAPLHLMVYEVGNLNAPYYAGLTLILTASSIGYRFTTPFHLLSAFVITGPYLLVLPFLIPHDSPDFFWLNSFALISMNGALSVTRFFNESVYKREFLSRVQLEHEIQNRDQIIAEKSAELVDVAVAKAVLKQNQQIAHDIRSPLTALNAISQFSVSLPPQERSMMVAVVNRIQDIANLLSQGVRSRLFEDSSTSVQLLAPLLEAIISEKRVEYRSRLDLSIELDISNGYGASSLVNQRDLNRIISNFINNSVEAIETSGTVLTTLQKTQDGNVEISILDNGRGVPDHVLAKLGERGVTHGKEFGQGLGLFHAKTTLGQWGADFQMVSEVGKFTLAKIKLKSSEPPEWLCQKVLVKSGQKIAVVDDDTSVHMVWDKRLPSFQIEHFSSFKSFKSSIAKTRYELILIDYESAQDDLSGLDFIEQNSLSDTAILVTSHSGDKEIQEKANRLGVKIIPKSQAGIVPLEFSELKG